MLPFVGYVFTCPDIKYCPTGVRTPIEPTVVSIATCFGVYKPRAIGGASVENRHIGYGFNVNPREQTHTFNRDVLSLNIGAI